MKKLIFITIFLAVIATVCVTCYAITSTLNRFNGGELSPQLDGRTDIEKYYSGCRILENFLILSYGAAVKRPGTYYVATCPATVDTNDNSEIRLVPFEFSTTQAYVLEFGNQYIRLYKNE